ncbi:protein tyrosine phosphatase [Rhodoferax mekongensis]|uniref:arsenate reductase/protein-tyrosine-phosphatase family protein n=1 Tax=Rhodoferax mekongensis TaxID=3068341 RepID=UPI0028BE7474|nr:protein tyrosine phosphatase [Rhodoferax sp. TBRC 17199]MDT7517063.1 protein tyrosine phosphatase [Rhodoferax sp. TBRC 17199]
MLEKPTRVLFVSHKNSARGLIAEACLRQHWGSFFEVSSCGVPEMVALRPDTTVLAVLTTTGYIIDGLQPKDWTDFARRSSKPFDIVIALDSSSKGQHPIWPGQPETALWSYPSLDKQKDETNSERDLRVIQTLHSLRRRVELLVSLPKRVKTYADLRHDIRDMNHL